jgi:hypothetical protein
MLAPQRRALGRIAKSESPVTAPDGKERDIGIVFTKTVHAWPIPECENGLDDVLQVRNALQADAKLPLFTRENLRSIGIMTNAYHWDFMHHRSSPPLLTDLHKMATPKQVECIHAVQCFHSVDYVLFIANSLAVAVLIDPTVLLKPTRSRTLAVACYLMACKYYSDYYRTYAAFKDMYSDTDWLPPKREVTRWCIALWGHYSHTMPTIASYGLEDLFGAGPLDPPTLRQELTDHDAAESVQAGPRTRSHIDHDAKSQQVEDLSFEQLMSTRMSRDAIIRRHLNFAMCQQWFYACCAVFHSRSNPLHFASWPAGMRRAFQAACRKQPKLVSRMQFFTKREAMPFIVI